MINYKFLSYLIAGLLVLFIFGCSDEEPIIDPMNPIDPIDNQYDETNYPGSEWITALPEEVGMDVDQLDVALDYAFMTNLRTQGVVVIRHGVIVAERYAANRDANALATSWSTAKSFASALIGIAIDEGYIDNVDDPVSKYLQEWQDTDKENISLRAILEMRSGLKVAPTEALDLYLLGGDQGDQLSPSINRIVEIAPHTEWSYQNANSMLLGEIVSRASGMDTQDFAETFLFSKIGMEAAWWQDVLGHTLTYCCIDATTRDFARFGLLYARSGKWNTEDVVSNEWVSSSTSSMPGYDFYGLHWRVANSNKMFASAGLHQNNIYVFPESDLVIVRNSIYNQQGSETIRVGNNFHETFEPMGWMELSFIQPILDALLN